MSGRIDGLDMTDDELTDAWVYLFGRFLVIRQEHIDLAEDGVTYNAIKHNPPVITGAAASAAPTFVNPNLDVVYSEAWIAVDAATPALLVVPEIPAGTYSTAQIVDEWAEITYNINARTMPDHPHGTFALCLEGSDPVIPDGAVRLDLPSAKAKLLVRVQMGADVESAAELQHGFSLSSMGCPQIEPAVPAPAFTNTAPPGAAMFAQPALDRALAPPDRSGHGDAFRPRLDRIAAFVADDPANARRIDEFVHTTAFPAFMQLLLTDLAEVGHGWRTTGNRGGFGTDYRFRTVANFAGIWWNSASEVIYYALQADETGHPPTGDHTYSIRFGPGESPGEHVDGYWSMTLYSHPDVRLVPNPIGVYSISYRTELVDDADGGFTVAIAPSRPDGTPESNWLPSTPPGQPWSIVLRLYLPRREVLEGEWSPPALAMRDAAAGP
jgi:hypothetical protein